MDGRRALTLRVALDATPLLGVRTGVAQFTAEALVALATRPELDLSAFALTWRGRGALAAALPRGVRAVTRPMAARPLRKAWKRGSRPPIEWWTGPIDVVHGTNFVVPPARRAAEVVTVHDLTAVRFPELCTPDVLEYPDLVRRALRRGAWVHTPSAAVAAEVVDLLGADPDRVVPVHHGIPGDRPDEVAPPPVAGPYLLAIGTIEPRKDMPSLVRAFDLVAADVPDVRLVVAGPDGWGVEAYEAAVRAARHRARIVRLGYVEAPEKEALLGGAIAFVFPSVYEGFGLPPLEAMRAGVPVVASDVAPLPEVLGDAALLVPQGDVGALAAALRGVLTDAELRDRLVVTASTWITRYSWSRCGDGLAQLYRRAAESRS